MYAKLIEAENWLIREGKRYGVDMRFAHGFFGWEQDISFPKIASGFGSGKERVDWVSSVLHKVGYQSPLTFHKWVSQKASNSQVLVFAKQKGNSYAISYEIGMEKELYFVEGAMLYAESHRGTPILASDIAHEVLHLYGAWDLYETFAQTASCRLLPV